MAKKKEDTPIVPQPAANAGDAVASGLFGNAAFRPVGETIPKLGSAIASGQVPTMMAGAAGANPLVASNVPQFPSKIGPLISTNYGLPPSERPDFRNPAMQWDAKPVTPAPNSVQAWAATPFRGNAATQAARQYEGLSSQVQSVVDRENMSSQALGVVDTSRRPLSGINAPINTSIQGMNVDRSPIATRVPQAQTSFGGGAPFNLASSPQPQQSSVPSSATATAAQPSVAANQPPQFPEASAKPALTRLQLPKGEAWVTAEQLKNYQTATARQQTEKENNAAQWAKFEEMKPQLAAAKKEAAEKAQSESIDRYNAFRQSLAEREARAALSTERGRTPDVQRGTKAMVEAEHWRQVREGIRKPLMFSFDAPLVFGAKSNAEKTAANPASVGAPTTGSSVVQNQSRNVPAFVPQFPYNSFGGQSFGNNQFTAFGARAAKEAKDDWTRRYFPQDYFNTQYGEGRRMIARNTPFDQMAYLTL
jgi:hypothetical protein